MSDKPEGYVFGRPTKYRPEMCEQVVAWGKLGKSKAWIASELDIARSTLDLWCDDHPDFSEAITRASAHAQRWWEDKGQENLTNREFNGPVWARSMGARFPDDWRESTKQDQTVTGTMSVSVVTGVPREDERPASDR